MTLRTATGPFLVAALLALPACGGGGTTAPPGDGEEPTATEAPNTDETANTDATTASSYRIGESVSLDGYMGPYGVRMHEGAQLAVKLTNDDGGVNGVPIDFISQNEASRDEQVLTVMERLIQREDVLAIHGPTGTDMAKAGWPYAAQHGVPVITSTTAPDITEIGECTFRYSLPESDLYPASAQAIKEELNPETAVLVFAHDESYSSSNAPFMEEALTEAGIEVVDVMEHSMDDLDFAPLVTRIGNVDPDLIATTTLPEPGASLMKEARRQGLEQPFLGGNAFNTPDIIELAGEAAEGLIVGAPWFLDSPHEANQQFLEAYREEFDKDPDQFAAQAFHGVTIIIEAIRAAEDRLAQSDDLDAQRTAVCEAMQDTENVDGPLGPVTFDETRTPKPDAVTVIQVRDGKFQVFP